MAINAKLEGRRRDGRRRCDRWGILLDLMGAEREGAVMDRNREHRCKAGWGREKTNSSLLYLEHLCRDKGPEQGFSALALLG